MIHNEKFKLEQGLKEGRRTVLLKGVIDEDSDFSPILKLKGPIVFNFRFVTAINSCGVRNWVNFLKQISDWEIYYEDCPPLVVRQLNMVPSFVGHAQVISVFGAYVCDVCDAEKMVLIQQERFKKGVVNIPEAIECESCKKGEMEFDGQPQQYFSFAR